MAAAMNGLSDRQSPCRANARLSPHISGHPVLDSGSIGVPQGFSNTFQGMCCCCFCFVLLCFVPSQ